jgi:ER degradation enhancer, mannosidase alpha-like 2
MRLAAIVSALMALAIPTVQQPPTSVDLETLAAEVKAEFVHSWEGYKRHAWGHDEVRPVSKTARDWYGNQSLLMTPVDSLDTMLLMGLTEEAKQTSAYILETLTFDKDISVSNFEITIRIFGGLLTAYQMTGEAAYLAKAEDLAKRLMPAFQSKTGMPYRFVNLKTGATTGPESNPAEIGTLLLEFGTLSKLTSNPVYYDTAKKAIVELYKRRDPKTHLVGQSINVDTGTWVNKSSHIGGAIDSYYEYLVKCEKLFADKECGDMWRVHAAALNQYVADEVAGALWYGRVDMNTGQRTGTRFGSLHAFFPGVLAMAGDLERARRLQESAFRMWTLHGIEPEGLDYATMSATSAGYQLRPEIVESAYILHHYTKDPKYVEMGRRMFDDLRKFCRTDAGYTVLRSVVTKEKGDLQHSFWLAETLKYLYLLFEPGALDFERHIFNTEAHPIRKTW